MITLAAVTRDTSDWLKHVHSATDTREADRCLDEAMAAATSCWEWRRVLHEVAHGPAPDQARVAEVAGRTLASARADGEVWGFRDVADARMCVLGDEDAARDALAAGIEYFQGRQTAPYIWALLAEGFLATLADVEGARRCLDAGLDRARQASDADGLASVATTMDTLGDRDSATALLVEAEALLAQRPTEVDGVWAVANAWHAMDNLEASTRLLASTTDRARTTEDALTVARAFSSHEDAAGAQRALTRARELATGAEEWYEVARATRDIAGATQAVRTALQRAAKLATGAVDRERIAAGFHQWLGDTEAADRVGPRGVRPEALRVPARHVDGWPPSASALFDWLRERMTLDILTSISEADYGMGVEENLEALLDIRTTGLVPRQLPWNPGEVLALRRWSRGEDVDHLERAWCCNLLMMYDEHDVENTAPALVESCLALGGEAPALAEQFLTWRWTTDHPGYDGPVEVDAGDPVSPVALLILCVATEPADPRIGELVRTILEHPEFPPEELGSLLSKGSIMSKQWIDLIQRILIPVRTAQPAVDELVSALGSTRRGW